MERMPKIFNEPVAMERVDTVALRRWIEVAVGEVLPDDDVAVDYLWELLMALPSPNIREIYRQMKEFLGDDTRRILYQMWQMMVTQQYESGRSGREKTAVEEEEAKQTVKQAERKDKHYSRQWRGERLRQKRERERLPGRDRLSVRDRLPARDRQPARDRYPARDRPPVKQSAKPPAKHTSSPPSRSRLNDINRF